MYRITVDFAFSYAHRLQNHPGKCRSLHGHNARVQVMLEAPRLDADGMIVDFAHVKDTIGVWLNQYWDHATILEKGDPLIGPLNEGSHRLLIVDGPPTAELMARKIYDYAVDEIDYKVVEVTLWETERCSASYRGDE